jgi:hypothetical protein
MAIPSPKDVKAKQAEKPASAPKGNYLRPDQVAKQQQDLSKLCAEAVSAHRGGVPMIVGTTGFCKKATEYAINELEEAGWKVEKGRRDGDFVFIITTAVESDFD